MNPRQAEAVEGAQSAGVATARHLPGDGDEPRPRAAEKQPGRAQQGRGEQTGDGAHLAGKALRNLDLST